jgi:hypothetical protein
VIGGDADGVIDEIGDMITDGTPRGNLANVCATRRGNNNEASPQTFTGLASILIFPHDTAYSHHHHRKLVTAKRVAKQCTSSGGAPASLPSYSVPVLIYTLKSAPVSPPSINATTALMMDR